jgi:hypothetical protein
MIWNASRPSHDSSSLTNALSLIYTQLLSSHADITHEMYKFDYYLEYLLLSPPSLPDTDSLDSHPQVLFLQDVFPNLFVDYHQALALREEAEGVVGSNGKRFPDTVSVICFPLSPKPHEVSESVSWVKEFWSTPTERF